MQEASEMDNMAAEPRYKDGASEMETTFPIQETGEEGSPLIPLSKYPGLEVKDHLRPRMGAAGERKTCRRWLEKHWRKAYEWGSNIRRKRSSSSSLHPFDGDYFHFFINSSFLNFLCLTVIKAEMEPYHLLVQHLQSHDILTQPVTGQQVTSQSQYWAKNWNSTSSSCGV